MDAVVGDVAGDDRIQARDADDRRGSGVGLPEGDDAQLVASRSIMSPSRASGTAGCPGIWPGKTVVQNCMKSGLSCPFASGTMAAAVTAVAAGNAPRIVFRPKK
jgi:hypothetical protein